MKQQIFDYVARHLLMQGQRSKHGGDCAYRGNNGLKCAVGCLIPDELYDLSMENMIWCEVDNDDPHYQTVVNTFPGLSFGLENDQLIRRLQWIHDRFEPCDWKSALRGLAQYKSLSAEVLNDY